MSETRPNMKSDALLVVRPGSYRMGAYVLFASGLLVFGGLWILVLVDWLQTGQDVGRIWVLGAIALVMPLGLLAWGLRRARRGRVGADFDQLELTEPAMIAQHRYSRQRQEIPWDELASLVMVRFAPPPGAPMPEWILELRLANGAILRSERLRFEDRLRRELQKHGLQWYEEDAS